MSLSPGPPIPLCQDPWTNVNQSPEPWKSRHPIFYYDLKPYPIWAWHSALNHCDRQMESSRLSLNKEGSLLLHMCGLHGGFFFWGGSLSEHNIGVCVFMMVVMVVGLTCVCGDQRSNSGFPGAFYLDFLRPSLTVLELPR